jgi:PAS domain S-box-containing protein
MRDRDTSADLDRALLAAIVAGSEDAIISKTLDGIVTSWNPAAERLFGWSAAEMVGQSILRVIPETLHAEEAELLARLREGHRIERHETKRLRKDCAIIDVSLTISPIRDASGRIVGASKIAHDITERKQTEIAFAEMAEELREREARLEQVLLERDLILESERAARTETERLGHLKDEFLATLSHELRTPLTAVQGWTTVLLQGEMSEEQSRALHVIDRNVRAQARIINDLLDMSRIVSGKIELDLQTLHLQTVIAAAVETARPAAEAKKIRLVTLVDSTVGSVRGDPSRLQQALWNLLSNAIKFTPSGGKIQITLDRVDSLAEVSIEDTGIGIQPEFLPHVFDRFRQQEGGITRRYGGLGLGLSIVRQLVELHGGTVRACSRGEQQGSTFVVSLPVTHAEPAADTRRRGLGATRNRLLDAADLPRLDGARILVVDDEADGRGLLARVLRDRGATCTEAGGGGDALVALAGNHFDMMLSDIGMPDMDGYELIREARALDETRPSPLPAIAITAYARTEDRQRSLLAGYQAHIAKPVDIPELVAATAGLLRLTR